MDYFKPYLHKQKKKKKKLDNYALMAHPVVGFLWEVLLVTDYQEFEFGGHEFG